MSTVLDKTSASNLTWNDVAYLVQNVSGLTGNDRKMALSAMFGLAQKTVYYASLAVPQFGTAAINLMADLSTPIGNTDSSSAFQAWLDAIEAAGGGLAYTDGAAMVKEINIPPNVIVTNGVGQSWFGVGAAPTRGFICAPKAAYCFGNKYARSNFITQLTGTTTNTSVNVTGLSSTSLLAVGNTVTGTGIPSGTTIASIVSSSAITLSQAATASGSVALVFKVEDFSRVQSWDLGLVGVFINANFRNGDANSVNFGQGTDSTGVQTNWADAYSSIGGRFIYALSFNGVRNLILRNVWVYDYIFGMQYSNVDGATFENLTFYDRNPNYPLRNRTANGLVCIGPARNITRVGNFKTWNSDDTNMFQSDPTKNFYPATTPDDAYRPLWYSGDIMHVRGFGIINNDGNGPCYAFYSGSERGSHLIDDVVDMGMTSATHILMESLGATANFGRIQFVNSRFTGDKALICQSNANSTHLIFDNPVLDHGPLTDVNGSHLASFEVNSSVPLHLDINNLKCEDNQNIPFYDSFRPGEAASLVWMDDPRFVKINGVSWNRKNALSAGYRVAGSVLSCRGATTGKLSLQNIHTAYVANVLRLTNGSAILEAGFNGIDHQLSGNHPLIYVDRSSPTVWRGRMSGVDTMNVINRTGVFTSLRTDLVEDQNYGCDLWIDTDGTDLAARTPDNAPASWVSAEGVIQTKLATFDKAQVITNGVDNFALYTLDWGQADVVLLCCVEPTNNNQGIVWRFTNLSNYWWMRYNFNANTISLLEVTGGSTVNHHDLPCQLGYSHLMMVILSGSTVTIAAQSAVDQTFPSYTLTGATSNQTATKHGIRGGAGAQFANFVVNKP